MGLQEGCSCQEETRVGWFQVGTHSSTGDLPFHSWMFLLCFPKCLLEVPRTLKVPLAGAHIVMFLQPELSMSGGTKSKGNTHMNQEAACFYNRQGQTPEGLVKPAAFSPIVGTFSDLTHLEAAALMDSRLSRPAWPPWDPLTMNSGS